MHILVTCARCYPLMGGIETHVHEVGSRLVAAGHRVTVATTDPSGQLAPRETVRGMDIRRVPAWPANRDYYFAPGMAAAVRDIKPDVVHVQGYHTLAAPIGMGLALRRRIPFLLTFHSGGHSSAARRAIRGGQRALLRPLLVRAAKLIGVSRFEVDFFSAALKLPRERFVHVPNGAEIASLAPHQTRDEGTLVVSVGRLERYKGHHRIIAAMPYLLRDIPDARLRIVGAGPYEATLRAMADASGAAHRISIGAIPPEHRAEMGALMSSAALVVLVSDYEAHPVTVMEALALGRPVLTADTSGFRELAEDGLVETVPTDLDPVDLAAAMARRIRAPGKPAVMLPDWDPCATRLAGLYADTAT